jgi:HEPN domain-containing protein
VTQAVAWFTQACSDVASAKRVLDRKDSGTYCQAIAKCQQTVEKGVKSVVAALDEARVVQMRIGRDHGVERFVQVLRRLPRRPENQGIQGTIDWWLDERWRAEIHAIDALVPRFPAPGALAALNTEYPFQAPDASWRAPAESGTFNLESVERFLRLAEHVHVGASKVRSAIKRAYP